MEREALTEKVAELGFSESLIVRMAAKTWRCAADRPDCTGEDIEPGEYYIEHMDGAPAYMSPRATRLLLSSTRYHAACALAIFSAPKEPELLPEFLPRWGDAVDTWLKRCRDEWPKKTPEWLAIDDLIRNYHECASEGRGLT